jgi:predicted Rossmann fold flavoprotein
MSSISDFDVIVIGAGPAGLMAAGQSALRGKRTLLIEKMGRPGRKLRITGKGRCNLTNDMDTEEFLSHFSANGSFLRQAFYRFFKDDLTAFFESIGIPTVVERGGRIFPKSGDADELTDKFAAWATASGADIRLQTPAAEILRDHSKVTGVKTKTGEILSADCVVLATGGASFTGTGSTGDGYRIAEKLGHRIIPLRPALVPIKTKGPTAKELQGLALRNVRTTILVDGVQARDAFGEMMFTHFGLSGPIILTMSGYIVDLLRDGKKVAVSIDLKPALDEGKLDARLRREFDAHGKTHFHNILKNLLPIKMIPVCAAETRIPAEKPCHQINQEERGRLLHWLKDFRLEVNGHLPLEAAMITQGGVSLEEVNPRTMSSKRIAGLYFAGEVLDLAADTGGFNLQAAFSTGWLAGNSVCGK